MSRIFYSFVMVLASFTFGLGAQEMHKDSLNHSDAPILLAFPKDAIEAHLKSESIDSAKIDAVLSDLQSWVANIEPMPLLSCSVKVKGTPKTDMYAHGVVSCAIPNAVIKGGLVRRIEIQLHESTKVETATYRGEKLVLDSTNTFEETSFANPNAIADNVYLSVRLSLKNANSMTLQPISIAQEIDQAISGDEDASIDLSSIAHATTIEPFSIILPRSQWRAAYPDVVSVQQDEDSEQLVMVKDQSGLTKSRFRNPKRTFLKIDGYLLPFSGDGRPETPIDFYNPYAEDPYAGIREPLSIRHGGLYLVLAKTQGEVADLDFKVQNRGERDFLVEIHHIRVGEDE